MTNREKEEKLVDDLKDPTEKDSSKISKMIDACLKRWHKVYCATDWHLWIRKEKNKPECHKCKNFEDIIKKINETMTKDDILIYMGDLVDGEYQDKDELKSILKTIPGKKILVRGNNDLFTTAFYKSCGFCEVVESFVWHNVIFSHMPCKNDNDINVHGHLHGYKTYWIPYSNQIDVAALGGREHPVELDDVISAQKSYSKTIKEDPSHFEEGYYNTHIGLMNIFEEAMSYDNPSFIFDPFPAE